MPNTTRLQLPYPSPSQNNDVPGDMSLLANALDNAVVQLNGLSTSRPAPALLGRVYFATDTGVISWDTGSSWISFQLQVPVVTALPTANLFDGQMVDYVASSNDGVVWRLRWRANSPNTDKWEFVGGSGLTNFRETGNGANTSSTTYTDINPSGPQTTPPLAGVYDIEFGAYCYGTAANMAAYMSFANGPTAASDSNCLVHQENGAAASHQSTIWGKRRIIVANANDLIICKYRVSQANAAEWGRRWLYLTPVRVRA